MLKYISAGLLLCLTFLASVACASNSGASPAQAQAQAADALGRLDGQTGTPCGRSGRAFAAAIVRRRFFFLFAAENGREYKQNKTRLGGFR